MSVNRLLQSFPEIETGLSEHRETLLLGALLIVGLTFIAPLLSIASGLPALVFVAFVGTLYAVAMLLLRRVLPGVLVAFIVTAGFAANVPLASNEYLRSITGAIGPELWLAQPVIVVGFVVALFRGRRDVFRGATLAELLFAGFVGWSVLAALFGATTRSDVALYFSLLMAQLLATIVLFRYAIQQRILRFRTVVLTFVGTVFAQSLFATGQFLNGGVFGVTTLGESGGRALSMFSLGPLGTISTGTYVSGFTGGQFILASLLVLALPMLFASSITSKGWLRAASIGGVFVMIVVLRATSGDAARGGLIVAGVSFVVSTVYLYRATLRDRADQVLSKRYPATMIRAGWDTLLTAAVSLLSIVLIMYPSSRSGEASIVTDVGNGGGTTTTRSEGVESTTTPAGSTTETTTPQASTSSSLLENLSVPYFDVSSLGIRLQQYLIGLELFVQYPLFGIGGGNFRYYATEYGLPKPRPMHNIYIGVLAETGLPGFLFYTGALVLIFWYGGKVVASRGCESLLLIGVLCGMIGYLSYGFFDYLQIAKPTSVFSFGLVAGTVLGQYRKETTLL